MSRAVSPRAVLRLVATLCVIAAAATVWHFLPMPTQVFAPFDVRGSVGQRVAGRPIEATVHDVRIAPEVTASTSGRKKRIAATGSWVVVDTTMQATVDPARPEAELLLDGNTYRPAERFLLENLDAGGTLNPGIPERGTWVFDVATNLVDRPAPFILRLWTGDGRLDSRLVISIGKHDASRQDVVALTRPRVTA
ncbi:MAG TPA: hypothetical protein VH496_09850 [Mycobacterium sp.]|jgi:hypothetical protein